MKMKVDVGQLQEERIRKEVIDKLRIVTKHMRNTVKLGENVPREPWDKMYLKTWKRKIL